MSENLKQSLYARVARAAEDGRGVRLTWEECCDLMRDTAFATRAELDALGMMNDDEEDSDAD